MFINISNRVLWNTRKTDAPNFSRGCEKCGLEPTDKTYHKEIYLMSTHSFGLSSTQNTSPWLSTYTPFPEHTKKDITNQYSTYKCNYAAETFFGSGVKEFFTSAVFGNQPKTKTIVDTACDKGGVDHKIGHLVGKTLFSEHHTEYNDGTKTIAKGLTLDKIDAKGKLVEQDFRGGCLADGTKKFNDDGSFEETVYTDTGAYTRRVDKDGNVLPKQPGDDKVATCVIL